MSEVQVRIQDLTIEFPTARGTIHAVNDVTLEVLPGRIMALVGESGCGKSTLAFSLLHLIPEPGRITQGQIVVDGTDLAQMNARALQFFRGTEVSMVFQAAMDSFNPVITFRATFQHILESHPNVWPSDQAALEYFSDLLTAVRLSPRDVLDAFPHQLSGGMKQRMAIALALALRPKVLVLDEPTTALDVVNQRLVLDVLKELHSQQQLTMLFVTHDLGVVADVATDVAVMYAGQVVEVGHIDSVFYRPEQHPYVAGLLASAPSVHRARSEVHAISGSVPDVFETTTGCSFSARCPKVEPSCARFTPALRSVDPTLAVRCPIVVPQASIQRSETIGTIGS